MNELIRLLADVIPLILILTHLLLAITLTLILLPKQKKVSLPQQTRMFLQTKSMIIALIIASLATLGSLFYSEIMNYNPCPLCWYQRIAMYPLVIITALSLKNPSYQVKRIIITLSSIGLLISAYHYITQLFPQSSFCAPGAASCANAYLFSYGYISIPLMAFTAFGIILLTQLVSRKQKKKK